MSLCGHDDWAFRPSSEAPFAYTKVFTNLADGFTFLGHGLGSIPFFPCSQRFVALVRRHLGQSHKQPEIRHWQHQKGLIMGNAVPCTLWAALSE